MKHPDSFDSRMWKHLPRRQACPAWMHRIAADLADKHARTIPRIALVTPSDPNVWGGRYFHDYVAIAVYDSGDTKKNKACLLHELGHWIEDKSSNPSDPLGRHSSRFYETLEILYSTHGISLAYAKEIEVQFIPQKWSAKQRW